MEIDGFDFGFWFAAGVTAFVVSVAAGVGAIVLMACGWAYLFG